METLELSFFPLPIFRSGVEQPGFLFRPPRTCDGCSKICRALDGDGIQECSYGINFFQVNDATVYGFLIRTPGAESSAKRKALRNFPDHILSVSRVEEIRERYVSVQKQIDASFRREKEQAFEEYRHSDAFKKDFLDALRPEMQKKLAFLHDYKQFVSRVKQHINVVLETRYLGDDFDDKLRRANPSEAAIYWAAELMEEKLNTISFVLQPERLYATHHARVRLHGLVLKYLRIYNVAFAAKSIKPLVAGMSMGEIRCNPIAIGVIPHTLLDNALKYSPRGGRVFIQFREDTSSIKLSVISSGPKIEESERSQIFEIFYRGQSAIKAEGEGNGLGLYLAQSIAKQMGTEIIVDQGADSDANGLFETTFSILFRRER